MRIYKVSFYGEQGDATLSAGFGFYPSKRQAQQAIADHYRKSDKDDEGDRYCNDCETEPLDIAPTKRAIIAALNRHGSHPDNG